MTEDDLLERGPIHAGGRGDEVQVRKLAVLGLRLSSLFDQESRDVVRDHIEALLTDGEPFSLDVTGVVGFAPRSGALAPGCRRQPIPRGFRRLPELEGRGGRLRHRGGHAWLAEVSRSPAA